MTLDMPPLGQWIGRTEDARDVATKAAPLVYLAVTLDRDDPELKTGDG